MQTVPSFFCEKGKISMVALVFCGDLKYCPYIKRYIERLEKGQQDYKVFFWNRGSFEMKLSDHYIYYDKSSELTISKIEKFRDFVKFRKWLTRQLSLYHCDKIIALSTLSGVFLGRYLYSGKTKYMFDIRDYSYEHVKPFYAVEKKVIENSAVTVISSAGFKAFLPKHNYIIAHNFNRNDVVAGATFKKTEGKINFVWNGVMRYYEFQKQYLNALKNDPRFNIIFHGDGPELSLFKEYCASNGFENVVFTGAYDNSDKAELLRNAHILNNCYGHAKSAEKKVKYAVPNRFYDGIIYHIPQIVEPEGYKSEWVKKAAVGENFAANESFADKLYEYYMNIESQDFNKACDTALDQVIKEDDKYIAAIDDFINK